MCDPEKVIPAHRGVSLPGALDEITPGWYTALCLESVEWVHIWVALTLLVGSWRGGGLDLSDVK